jgi:hypothetical protein
VSKSVGVATILHKIGYSYAIGGARKYYNPFYVNIVLVMRREGSRENTEDFEV